MPIESPEDVRQLIDSIIGKLDARQQHEAANRLRQIQATAFTTSSEWLGELGLAIRVIRKDRDVDPDIQQALDHLMRVVKSAWPGR